MSDPTIVDETANFTAESTDTPELAPEAQEQQQEEAPASAEIDATEAKDQPEEVSEGEAGEGDQNTGDDATADTEDKKPTGKKSDGVQKRIDKIVKEREQERRKREALEKEIAEYKSKKPDPVKESNEPKEQDFDTYDAYLDALDEYDNNSPEQKETIEQDKNPEEKPEGETELTDSQKTAMAVIQEKADAAEKPEDFEAVALDPSVPVTAEMVEALAECDDPAKVLYHLGKNKDIAASIAEGSPAQQMREIAKLDLTVKVKPAKPVKTTEAPEPISPLNGNDVQQKSVNDMSFSEYEAHQNKIELSKKSNW